MDGPEAREELGPVTAEVAVDRVVGLEAEVFAGRLHGDDFAVVEVWGRAPLAQAHSVQHVLEGIVRHAVHSDEKGFEVHGRLRLRLSSLGRPLNASGSLPWTSSSSSRNLHTGLTKRCTRQARAIHPCACLASSA